METVIPNCEYNPQTNKLDQIAQRVLGWFAKRHLEGAAYFNPDREEHNALAKDKLGQISVQFSSEHSLCFLLISNTKNPPTLKPTGCCGAKLEIAA